MAVFLRNSFDLDVEPGALPPILRVKQYDGDATKTFTATVYRGSEYFTIPDTVNSITVEGSKPDGTGFSYNCSFSGSLISFYLMRQMTVLYGDVICDFVFYDSSENRISSHTFILRVHRAAVQQDQIESSDDYQTLVSYVSQAENYWKLSKSYAIGGTGIRDGEDTNNSHYNWLLSRSYALGGTGIRTGEDINNAKYYSELVAADRSQIQLNTTSIAALDSLIDQYVTPSEQYPDEVVAARVGYDGTVYDTLGDAIRKQATKFGYIAANEEIYFSNNS